MQNFQPYTVKLFRAMLQDARKFSQMARELQPLQAVDQGTSLARLRKDAPELAAKTLHRLLEHLQSFLNFSERLPPAVVAETVQTIQKEYYFLKFEEIVYCFQQAKFGRWGSVQKLQNSRAILQPETVFAWLQKYDVEVRSKQIASRALSRHEAQADENRPSEQEIKTIYKLMKGSPALNSPQPKKSRYEKEKELHKKAAAMASQFPFQQDES